MDTIRVFFFIFCVIQSLLLADEWKTVNLASYPRSGNHWVRYLVEEATRIATSSIYTDGHSDGDIRHLEAIFPWGGYCANQGYEGNSRYPTEDDPVLLKTHYPLFAIKAEPDPERTICLIRHPIDSFWSYYLLSGGDNDNKIDKVIAQSYIEEWRFFYEYWEKQPNVLFIRYEDLLKNTELSLSNILHAAGYVFTEMDVKRAVDKYGPLGNPLKHIEHYDAEAVELIKTELRDHLVRFNYENL